MAHKRLFFTLIIILIVISNCTPKNLHYASLPGCGVKFSENQILSMAQQYLDKNHPKQIIKKVELTGCEDGKSTFTGNVYESEKEIAALHINGNSGDIIYFKK